MRIKLHKKDEIPILIEANEEKKQKRKKTRIKKRRKFVDRIGKVEILLTTDRGERKSFSFSIIAVEEEE